MCAMSRMGVQVGLRLGLQHHRKQGVLLLTCERPSRVMDMSPVVDHP